MNEPWWDTTPFHLLSTAQLADLITEERDCYFLNEEFRRDVMRRESRQTSGIPLAEIAYVSDRYSFTFSQFGEICRRIDDGGDLEEAVRTKFRQRADLQESYRLAGVRWSSRPLKVLREKWGEEYAPTTISIVRCGPIVLSQIL